MDNNIYITKTFIGENDQSELDFTLQDQFGFDYERFDDFITIENGVGSTDATPMNIDDMIKILNDLKSKGATHIEINDHCDHHGYNISGFEIRKSTDEEVNKFKNKTK